MKKITILIGTIIVILLIAINIIPDQNKNNVIKIGWQGPLSGQAASYGEVVKAATEIAVDEINQSGGINGAKLEVIYDDDQCTAQGAVSATKKQIEIDNVVTSITSACSPSALSAAPIFEENKIPQLIYCAASPNIKTAGDYIFRIVPSDNILAPKMAEYIVKDLNKNKIAIIYINNDWGTTLKKDLESELNKLGGEVIISESHTQEGSSDMRTIISKISSKKPEIIIFASYPTGIILGVKQMEELKTNSIIIGAGAAWDSQSTWEKTGKITRDISFFTPTVSNKTDLAKKITEKTGNTDIFSCAYYSYDAVKTFAKSLENTSDYSPKNIKNLLYNTKNNSSISQPSISFDSYGELINPQYEVKKVINNKISY